MGNCCARLLALRIAARRPATGLFGRRFSATLIENEEIPEVSIVVPPAAETPRECVEEVHDKDANKVSTEPLLHPTEEDLPPHCDFLFLTERSTVEWIEQNRVLFLMRGVPGSGKSTIVKHLLKRFPQAKVCSADNFWIDPTDGQYKFDAKRLKDAHNWCQNEAFQALRACHPTVVIDNTNVRNWEYRYYTDLTKKFAYLIIVVTPRTPWRFNASVCVARNSHGVALDVIEQKIKEFEPTLPLYFGWFLGDRDCEQLRQCSDQIWDMLLQGEDSRKLVIKDFLKSSDKPRSAYALDSWFKSDKLDPLHVTAKFCLFGRTPGSREYCASNCVWNQQAAVHALQIVGMLVTPRTRAAIVKLPPEVLVPSPDIDSGGVALWQGEDKQMVYANASAGPDGSVSRPSGTRAHITLAVGANVAPVQAGLDWLQVWDLINSSNHNFDSNWCCMTQWGMIQYLREGRFYMNFEQPLIFPALFTPRF